ncbi:MAG: ribose 1,5-bisphosphate isomerase [Candidatus Aenigmatarchaeota archaeon]|nr:MAG: ribose 1,5-bisphosphate isomerase [Candidatus Aenigmarchaeota archaeon]
MGISEILSGIKSLKIQGARAVALAGLRAFELKLKTAKNRGELRAFSKKLLSLRPTEPSLKNAIAYVMGKIEEIPDFQQAKRAGILACREYEKKLQESLDLIAEIGSGQIQEGETILTHCHSSSVMAILKRARSQGKKFRVIVTETRPKLQGLITAKELLRARVQIVYCVDSAIGWVMKKVDKVLVGCDAILADGSIVNKIGTFPIALVAKAFGVPFLVSAGTYKFDPETVLGVQEIIEERDPAEIIQPRKLPGAKIINPTFDITPAEYIQALITEKGIIRPELVRELLV